MDLRDVSPHFTSDAFLTQRGLAALGRNQKTPLQILAVTIVTMAGYGDGLEIFVKFLAMFEVSSTDEVLRGVWRASGCADHEQYSGGLSV